jgi:ubiquitin carboxyl-terminal hydrolase 9/24
VFLNLTHLQAASYNPQIFVQSFKGWDGEPINVNVQMDVHEFWSMLYDRLEENLKKTSQPNLLQHTFGGVVSNQLICQGCPHRFDRQETFSHISVEIQHASNLQEGLAKFVQGEMLSGSNAYHCGTCDAKVIFMSIFITFMILQKFQLFIFVRPS